MKSRFAAWLLVVLVGCVLPASALAQVTSPPPPSAIPGPTGQNVPPGTVLRDPRSPLQSNVTPFVPNPNFDPTKKPSGANPQFTTGFPNDFPIPMHPWYGVMDPKRVNYGSAIQQIEVPPQQVIVNVYVPGPGSFSGGFEPQLIEIPGYVVTETSTGYIYPARVGLRETTPGVFYWVPEPSVFVLK